MSKVFDFLSLPIVRRIFTLVLLLGYALSYMVLPVVLPQILRSLLSDGRFFGFSIVSSVSYAAVTLGLAAATFGAFVPTWRLRLVARVQLTLAGYLIPHTLVVGFWCVINDKHAWID